MIIASIGNNKYRLALSNGRHEFSGDEPAEKGGTDTAPSPEDLLQASLASCTLATLRMYADRKEWPVEKFEVMIDLQRNGNSTTFTREIILHGDLTEEQKSRLLQVAKSCPVSKILEGEIIIDSSLKKSL